MANRTSIKAVSDILARNYDPRIQLQPFMTLAGNLVDKLVTEASAQGVSFPTADRELCERWLTAYWYTMADPLYVSRSSLGGSGSFRQEKVHPYLQAATALDPTETLMALLEGTTATGGWLGTAVADQQTYDERNGLGGFE